MKVVKYLKIMVAVAFSICLLGGCTSKSDIEDTTRELIVEGLTKTDELMKVVSVVNVEECTLVKESDNKYKGCATVNFKVRNDGSSFTASYNLAVIYDGEMVLLDDCEMCDQDWAKLCERIGLTDDEEQE